MTVNYNEYNEIKKAFFAKHDNEFKCDTSSLDDYGCYHKIYTFEDGAAWYEVMTPEHVQYEVEVKAAMVKASVKMLKTEFWNSDDSHSRYYYEQF